MTKPNKPKPLYGYDEGAVYVITDEKCPDRHEGLSLADRIDAVSREFDLARGTDGFLDEVLISRGPEWQETPEEIAAATGRSVVEVEQAIRDLKSAEALSETITTQIVALFRDGRHVRDVASLAGMDERLVQAVIAMRAEEIEEDAPVNTTDKGN